MTYLTVPFPVTDSLITVTVKFWDLLPIFGLNEVRHFSFGMSYTLHLQHMLHVCVCIFVYTAQ